MNIRARQGSDANRTGEVVGGRYELVRQLAYGGMGAVYEARNTATLKRCAVKLLLSSEVKPDSPEVKRFIAESRSSSRVESDHIVHVFDAGIDASSDTPYIVMELLRGEDLRALLKRLPVLPPELVVRLALQASTGLGKAHAAGVVHRDIKPANLFLTQRDNGEFLLKIVDFGIAKVRTEGAFESQETLTQGGHVLGTPAYMSPQQARGERDAAAHSDVWSLGIVMFELFTGRLPYSHTTPLAALMTAIATETLPSLREVAPWVPADLAGIVERATARDVRARYRDALELHEALQNVCGDDARITRSLLRPLSEAERLASGDSGLTLSKPYLGDDQRVTRDLPDGAHTDAPKQRPRRAARRLAVVAALSSLALLVAYVARPRPGVDAHTAARSATASLPASASLSPRAEQALLPTKPSFAASPAGPPPAVPDRRGAAPRPARGAPSSLVKGTQRSPPETSPTSGAPPPARQRAQLSDAVDEFR